jgi:hypothetical protein
VYPVQHKVRGAAGNVIQTDERHARMSHGESPGSVVHCSNRASRSPGTVGLKGAAPAVFRGTMQCTGCKKFLIVRRLIRSRTG